MLTRFRIEVQEKTVAETVDALARYEHAILTIEAQRYEHQWPKMVTVEPSKADVAEDDHNYETGWYMKMPERNFFIEELGVEVTDEVIEFDKTIPGYRGRRVVQLVRIDTRDEYFLPLTGTEQIATFTTSPNSGTNP